MNPTNNYYHILSPHRQHTTPKQQKQKTHITHSRLFSSVHLPRFTHPSTEMPTPTHLDGFTLINKSRKKKTRNKRTNSFPPHSPAIRFSKTFQSSKKIIYNQNVLNIQYLVNNLDNAVSKSKRLYSLFASQKIISRPAFKMTSPSTPSTTPSPDATPTGFVVSPDGKTQHKQPIKIDLDTDDSIIKSIAIEDTWSTYIFNSQSPSYSEESWNTLDETSIYDELLNLKLPVLHDITSPFSTYVVTADTDNASINCFPLKECKLLLTAYATNQGYPHFVSRLDDISVDDMRLELINAKRNSRPLTSPTSSKKKLKQVLTPFVLTHETSNDEISSTPEDAILHELKIMFTDRGTYDSVEWDSLSPDDVRDMARIERDGMLKCINESKVVVKTENDKTTVPVENENSINVKEIINIADDDSDDDTLTDEDGDKIFEDATGEELNKTDKFVQEQADKAKKEPKTFKFRFNHETTDADIFLLNHRRAIRIAQVHADRIEEPLSPAFIANATTEEVHQYLIHERNQFVFQDDYDKFDFSSRTTDSDIKSLPRIQLENFIIFKYRDTDRQLSPTFFDGKTDMELKYLLISERNMMRANDPTFNTQQSQQHPTPPDTMPKGLHGKRQNLNG